jgi:hypothetical protein
MSNRQEASVLAKGIGPSDDAVAEDGHAPCESLIRAPGERPSAGAAMSNRQEASELAKGIGPFDIAVAGDGHPPRESLIRPALPESARPRAQQCPTAKRHLN